MTIERHSIRVDGAVTSITMEPEFWEELKLLCETRDMKASELVTRLAKNDPDNLCRAIRLEILHAKNLEIANLRKMVLSISKTALDGVKPPASAKMRAVR